MYSQITSSIFWKAAHIFYKTNCISMPTHPRFIDHIYCIAPISSWSLVISIWPRSWREITVSQMDRKDENFLLSSVCILGMQQVLVLVNMTNLPRKQFSNADFPALLGPKTKHWKTFLSLCCFLRSKRLLLVRRMAEAGSPGNPM